MEKVLLDLMRDDEVWCMACSVIAVAGQRAKEKGLLDVEHLCAFFAHRMHELVGTPALPLKPKQ